MVLKPVTVKLDDKEIRYLDSLKGKGKITSRSSAVRAVVRESMERTDLCRGSAWTEVNRSSKGRTAKNGSGGSAKARAGPNITFEDVVVDNRISAGELKVAEDGRVLQADDETIKAMHQKRWFNPMKVVWTEYRPLYPDECPPGPYIHWRVRQSRAAGSEPVTDGKDTEPQTRPVRRRRISDATLEFLRTHRSSTHAAVMHRFCAVYGRTDVRGVGNRPEGHRRLYGHIRALMCSTGLIADMVHQVSSETGGYQLVEEGRGRGSDVCSDDLASVSRGSGKRSFADFSGK